MFYTVDAKLGYLQVEIDKNDRRMILSTTHNGHFQFDGMILGIQNAQAILQRSMGDICFSAKWQSALVCLDDIVILKSMEVHIQQVKKVRTLSSGAEVSLKRKKCSFFAERIDRLGHVINTGRLELVSTTRKSIQELMDPRTKELFYPPSEYVTSSTYLSLPPVG